MSKPRTPTDDQMLLAARLREERARLGLTAERQAGLGGVTRGTQFGYEAGERSPDTDYLRALSQHGVDVLYVITGRREQTGLGVEERDRVLLDRLANLPESLRQLPEQVALLAFLAHQGRVDDLPRADSPT